MTDEQLFVTSALSTWETWVKRSIKILDTLTDEQLFSPIAPGRNRAVYIFGHLLAINDSLFPQTGLGEATVPHYREIFVTKPDRAVADADLPSAAELRQQWKQIHDRLTAAFQDLTPAQWLEKHTLVSDEDFAKEPHRNRYTLLVGRASHLAYHIGQLVLLTK